MNVLLWAMIGWGAVSLLALPVAVGLCRCVARFDPPVEQLAAATLHLDVLRTAGRGRIPSPPAH